MFLLYSEILESMCKQCFIVGTLINAGGKSNDDDFPCQSLARYDCSFHSVRHLIDVSAQEYLSDTLADFLEQGIDLVPIQV